ncbi:hypothetical protein [Agaribacter marinus]|uniref:Uncharacterized protein n=1 Tax=Agaribacter marinus TaxID=1431249 RepID=A0AA37SUH0_9ALTE|nr:hypothetical protein [Agaribacter marinus]GLR69487.1 hypothetical protein GCM10007852_03950 [Agaribacter marinus]
MFNRSIKYIVLLALNISILLIFYPTFQDSGDGIFETEFVIDLISERDELKEELSQIQNEIETTSTTSESASTQLAQTQALILKSEEKAERCEIEKTRLIAAVNEASDDAQKFAQQAKDAEAKAGNLADNAAQAERIAQENAKQAADAKAEAIKLAQLIEATKSEARQNAEDASLAKAKAEELAEKAAKAQEAAKSSAEKELLAKKEAQRLAKAAKDAKAEAESLNNNLLIAQAEAEKSAKNASLVENATANACDAQAKEIAMINEQLKQKDEHFLKVRDENIQLQTQISQLNKALKDEQNKVIPSSNSDEKVIAQLKERIAKLEADIENPIYLKSVYMTGRKCSNPRFEDIVCIEEFIVRPKFSKAPITDVTVNVYSPENRRVARATFASDRAQLVRLSLGRGRELTAGEYRAEFIVNDETLVSDGHLIARK